MTGVVAIFPWGETIEEFLEPIGLGLEDFATRMTGGWLFGYVAALQSAGWRPLIVCASDQVRIPTRLTHAATGAAIRVVPGTRVDPDFLRRHPSRAALRHWLQAPWRAFAKVLREERCTAILAQEYEYARLEVLCLLGRWHRIPVYASFQGGDRTASRLEARLRARSLSKCGGLICASQRERGRLHEAYGARLPRVVDIPNPLDTHEWQPQSRSDARRELDLPQDAFIVINHGRIDIRRKGLDVLLAAWRSFGATRADTRLVIIGSGQDHAVLASMLGESNAANTIWIADYITDRPLLRRWLAVADVYLTTSRTEGMPVAPLEAMAMGLPVISSDAQGLPDIFESGEASGGLMVARDDVPGVVVALERLYCSLDLRACLGAAARARVESHFSVPAVGQALDRVLRENASCAKAPGHSVEGGVTLDKQI